MLDKRAEIAKMAWVGNNIKVISFKDPELSRNI